jgi:hypothetical protein
MFSSCEVINGEKERPQLPPPPKNWREIKEGDYIMNGNTHPLLQFCRVISISKTRVHLKPVVIRPLYVSIEGHKHKVHNLYRLTDLYDNLEGFSRIIEGLALYEVINPRTNQKYKVNETVGDPYSE